MDYGIDSKPPFIRWWYRGYMFIVFALVVPLIGSIHSYHSSNLWLLFYIFFSLTYSLLPFISQRATRRIVDPLNILPSEIISGAKIAYSGALSAGLCMYSMTINLLLSLPF